MTFVRLSSTSFPGSIQSRPQASEKALGTRLRLSSQDLFRCVRFLTAEVKGKFISRSSYFYHPDWALTVFYESILANCVA